MATTNFTAGTVIASSWLNDVDDITYRKSAETISVKDPAYGAVGDGVTDDTAAFTAALAVGKPVYVPSGTYVLKDLNLNSNAVLFGDGMRKTIFIPATGTTAIIQINATSVAKQNITIRDVGFKNPNNIANCYALWFRGTDVNSINDAHTLTNIEIGPSGWYGTSYPFLKGVYATGRLIGVNATNLQIYQCTKGWHSATAPATPAFNAMIFNLCVFAECEEEGFYHTGQSTNVKFVSGYIQQNNTDAVAGVAGIYFEDIFNWDFDNVGFEGNGYLVAVDTGNPLGGSISMLVGGTICQNLIVRGGYFTASGANIVIKDTVTNMTGGRISCNYMNCGSGGFNFAALNAGPNNPNQNQLVFEGSNQINGQVTIYSAGVGQSTCVEQGQGIAYITTAQPIDLLTTAKIVTNPGATLALTTINNRLPGCTLDILNHYGANSVTIAAALMQNGALSTVSTGTYAKYVVLGSPDPGKLVRVY